MSPQIETLVVPTRNRPASLLRCVSSYLGHAAARGRRLDCIVIDDSDDELAGLNEIAVSSGAPGGRRVTMRRTRERIGRATARRVGPGTAEAKAILAACGCDTGQRCAAFSRNAALLATRSRGLLSVDDDTVCTPSAMGTPQGPVPQLRSGWLVSERWNARDRVFFGALPLALEAVRPCDVDVLGEHAAALAVGAQLATNGVVGEAGAWAPSYVVIEAITGEWNGQQYQSAMTRQVVVETATDYTLGSASYVATTFYSMHNQGLVPPFIPVARGEDVVFSTVWRAICPGLAFAYLPWVLRHDTVEGRSGRQPNLGECIGIEAFELLVDTIRAWASAAPPAAPSVRCAALGEALIGVARLEPPRLRGVGRQLLRTRLERRRELLRAALEGAGSVSLEVAADARAHLRSMERASAAEATVVLDDGFELDREFGPLLERAGALLMAWPQVLAVVDNWGGELGGAAAGDEAGGPL